MKRTFILFCVFAMGIYTSLYSQFLNASAAASRVCSENEIKNCTIHSNTNISENTPTSERDKKFQFCINHSNCITPEEIDTTNHVKKESDAANNQAAGGALTPDLQKLQREAALNKAMAKNGEIYKCVDSTETAKDDCNLDRSDDMKGFFNFGKGMAMQGAAMTGAAQTAAQCNKFQQLSDLASTGLSGFKLYCATGVKSCSSACSDAKKFLTQNPQFQFRDDDKGYVDADDRIRKATKDCGKLTGSIAEAGMYIFTMVNNHAMAKQCQQILGKAENDMCKTHKELCDPNANFDCNNPQVALTNMVCKCRNNPNLADCNTGMGGLANNNNAIDPNSSADMSGFGNGAGGKILPGGGETPEQYGFPFEGKPGEGKANLSLGKGGAGHGGGGNGGAGGGGPAGAQKGAGGGTGLNAGILNGWNGGRGGAGGWGGAGGSGWADGKNGAAGNGNGRNPYMTVDKNGNPVDLRQFLPGQKLDATRGIAGISGPDGITGPNSSLWDKVRVRYNAQRNFVP